MPDTTPTTELRAAAALLHSFATAAHRASPAPWKVTDEHVVRCADGMIVADRSSTDHPAERADLPYLAAMHPGVGLALAGWLVSEARHRDAVDVGQPLPSPRDEHALVVARLVLGTTDQQPEGAPVPVDRAAVLREAANAVDHLRATMLAPTVRDCYANGLGGAAARLRRMADEAQQPETEAAAPQCTAGLLPATEAAVDRCVRRGKHDSHVTAAGARWGSGSDDAPAADQPTGCGPVPDACDAEAGDPCANHEREEAHADGEHAFCGSECQPAADQPDTETEAAPVVAWSSVGSLFCTSCCDGHPDYRAARVTALPRGGTCDGCGSDIPATTAP